MKYRSLLICFLLALSCSFSAKGHQNPPPGQPHEPPKPGAPEFPVLMQQSVTAGKTAVGTRVEAKLGEATLVNGTVIPRNALLSGEVVESSAKTKTDPSRLSIRLNSAQWKNGSAPIHAYLTLWYYLSPSMEAPDLQSGPEKPANRTWNGMGQYPSNSPAYHPFPSGAQTDNSPTGTTTTAESPNHRLKMKEVESQRNQDGSITLVSNHSTIKLDKATMYVFGGFDLSPAPQSTK